MMPPASLYCHYPLSNQLNAVLLQYSKHKKDIIMKIDFKQMDATVLEKFKGGEKQMNAKMFVDEHNRIMQSVLIPGASIGMHCHTDSSEIIYIISGNGMAICEGRGESLTAGDCHYCPKGQTHTLINNGTENLVFFAVVPQQ